MTNAHGRSIETIGLGMPESNGSAPWRTSTFRFHTAEVAGSKPASPTPKTPAKASKVECVLEKAETCVLHGAKGGRTRLLNEERGPPPPRSSTRASAARRNHRTGRPPAGRPRTRGRCGRPARRARRSARSGRRARSSPRSPRFRVPRPKRSARRPSIHREPARGRARLRST